MNVRQVTFLLQESLSNGNGEVEEESDATEGGGIEQFMILHVLLTSRVGFECLRDGLIRTISSRGERD